MAVAPGSVNDFTAFDSVLDALGLPRLTPDELAAGLALIIADKAYASRASRQSLRRRGIPASDGSPLPHTVNGFQRGRAA
ncbi:hypothetical protein [Streptomyces sp. NPDC059928]|uniref:hypothetical protein n=1 Tax=unclassified Streptomyces TaxID=2593676 RepID=UPI00365232A4